MANYTYAQLEGLWIQNGGSPATAPIAAAIAEAESGGNPAATSANPTDGGTNVGLWQLDTKGKGAGITAVQLQDPDVNASAAVIGSGNGTNWSAWETFANGHYKAFLNAATTPNMAGLPITSNTVSAAQSAQAATAASPAMCVIPYPTINLVITQVGGGCILTKSEARAAIGALCLGVAGIIGLAAAVILAASAFERSGAARAVGQAVPAVRTVTQAAGKAAPRAS